MARLVLMRHAKADTPPGVRDIDRPLAVRGRADAVAAARWVKLHDQDWPLPMLVLVSPALRTQQTFEPVAGVLPTHDHRDEPAIYDAATDTLRALVAEQPAELRTLVMVGHNPGFHSLAAELSSSPVEHFSTGTIAILDADDWHAGPGTWTLHDLHVPRG